MNNGTFAATTLGDAMSRQSSGSFAESTDGARTPLRDVLDALDDALDSEASGLAGERGMAS